MVTFKELENAKAGETILLAGNVKRIFLGFSGDKTKLVMERICTGEITGWTESEIEHWTIEKPEPKPIAILLYCIKAHNNYEKGDIFSGTDNYRREYWIRVTINEKGEILKVEP